MSCITRLDQAFKSISYHPAIQGNNCQDYGHVAVNCPSPVKVTKAKEPSVTNSESLPHLLPTPSVVIYPSRQHLPPLLLTLSLFIVATDKLSITESESDSEEFIYQVEKPEDYSLTKKSKMMALRNPELRVLSS